jgi:hypothetical protein
VKSFNDVVTVNSQRKDEEDINNMEVIFDGNIDAPQEYEVIEYVDLRDSEVQVFSNVDISDTTSTEESIPHRKVLTSVDGKNSQKRIIHKFNSSPDNARSSTRDEDFLEKEENIWFPDSSE